MIKIVIKSIFGSILFEYEKDENTMKDTLIEAVNKGANLEGANLRGAYLRGANLRGANLEGAYLRGANLRGANLEGANLRGAYLRGAYLEGANLEGANLRGANLEGANLRGANLRGANLRGAYHIKTTERYNQCMQNILFVLGSLPSEVPNLRQLLLEGKVDGSQYEGECCCLIGSLGNNKACEVIPFYNKGLHNFGEQWFYQIKEGDTDTIFVTEAIKCCDIILSRNTGNNAPTAQ